MNFENIAIGLLSGLIILATLWHNRERWFGVSKKDRPKEYSVPAKEVKVTEIIPPGATPATPPPPTPATSATTNKEKKRVWWKWAGALALGVVVILVAIKFGGALYHYYNDQEQRPITSSISRSNAPFAVGMEAIKHEICLAESGCQQFKDGKLVVHVNEDGSEDVGIYQFNKPTWEREIKENNLGLDLEKEGDQEKLFRYAVLRYNYGPWAKSLYKWGKNVHEPISLTIFATKKWTEEIKLPEVGGRNSFMGNGHHYKTRYHGKKATFEAEYPTPAGYDKSKEPNPGEILGYQFMSLEDSSVAITLIITPKPTT